jgi:uncharacterized protein YjbI with pentapeptide repeats
MLTRLMSRIVWPIILALATIALIAGLAQTGKLGITDTKGGLAALLSTAVVALVVTLWKLPKAQVAHLKSQGIAADRLVELEDKARATLAQAIGGALLLVTAYCSWQSIGDARRSQEQQFSLAMSAQITDRFTRAVDQLNTTGDSSITKRLGGVYALERIARDSPADRRPVMEVLTAYVRQRLARSTSRDSHLLEAERGLVIGGVVVNRPLAADVQAVLTVIGRRGNDLTGYPAVDLHGTDLRGAEFPKGTDLSGANLEGTILKMVNLEGVRLEGADLYGADLPYAVLPGADLKGAYLCGADFFAANMQGAHLEDANLTDARLAARLDGAHLRRAQLTSAVFLGASLERADLRDAILTWADLRQTRLVGADLSRAVLHMARLNQADLAGANLHDADLRGADLTLARNLTQSQLDQALTNENTKVTPPLRVKAEGKTGVKIGTVGGEPPPSASKD